MLFISPIFHAGQCLSFIERDNQVVSKTHYNGEKRMLRVVMKRCTILSDVIYLFGNILVMLA